ncbi:glycosyltransferase family 4 protein [Peribacillus sp. Hz7]|uniref:glycosyltransferase family 4 protein n=1 Tax=Peribacillus sp. Hz7 TaxID=3344873 RepID=UPI0035CC57A7
MKLLFVHETKMKEDKNGNFYTGGSYNQEVWDRYLSISDELTVISRKDSFLYDKEYARKNFNFFNKEQIGFFEIPDLQSSIKMFVDINERMKRNETIKNEVLKSDYIIARLPSSAGNQAIQYAKKYKKPYLVEVVGCPRDSLWNHGLKGKIISPFVWFNMKKKVENAPYTLYVTNDFLQRRYPCKGNTIGCSDVVLPKVDETVLEKRLNKIKGLCEEKPIVLGTTAAVNVKYKGQEYVFKAISMLNKEGYNFEYYLAGGGDNSYLKSLAEDYGIKNKVKFLGALPHEKVFEYLDKIDIYIQPSKTEGLPRALVEAMSRGCPSLGSEIGGIPELLNRKFIFRNGSVNEICTLLKMMNKKTMLEEAKRSFGKAKEYDKELLDKKRSSFYKMYAEGAMKDND